MRSKAAVTRFDEWLDIATHKLCDAAHEKIALEMRAHFEAARQDFEAQGIHPIAAADRALAALGDPEKAGKAFRKVHLSIKEQRLLDEGPWRMPFAVIGFISFCALYMMDDDPPYSLAGACLYLYLTALQPLRQSDWPLQRFIAAHLLFQAIYSVVLLITRSEPILYSAFMFLVFNLMFHHELRLRGKALRSRSFLEDT